MKPISTNEILPLPSDVSVQRYECFSHITWTVSSPDEPLFIGVEIHGRAPDGEWEQLCTTTYDSFNHVFDILAPVYQYRVRCYGTDHLFSDWIIATVKSPERPPLPAPIERKEDNYWRAQYFQALRELTNANKGIRRLKIKYDRLTQTTHDIQPK